MSDEYFALVYDFDPDHGEQDADLIDFGSRSIRLASNRGVYAKNRFDCQRISTND